MLKQLQKRKDESGFSIIEVLIVLAIAGLIMVVVFLAVPALNRNSHNNQYKTEARNLLGAVQEVMNNKGGSALTDTATDAADTNAVKTAANAKQLTNVTIVAKTTNAQTPAVGAAAVIVLASKCTASNSNVPAGSAPRNVALIFQLEAAGAGNAWQCIDE